MDLDLARIRRPSHRFGWVDRRVVTDGHLSGLSQAQVAVYLVLCVLADRYGLSWYGPETLARLTRHPAQDVAAAIASLAGEGLVAVAGRFVQVLDLGLLVPRPPDASRGPVQTQGTGPGPAVASLPKLSAHDRLAQLSGDTRVGLLRQARARLLQLTPGREPSPSVLEAVAAGLLDGRED